MEFNNIIELKARIMPALKIRVRELKKQNIYFTEESLFRYFVKIWKEQYNLTLSDIVDDILNRKIDEEVI